MDSRANGRSRGPYQRRAAILPLHGRARGRGRDRGRALRSGDRLQPLPASPGRVLLLERETLGSGDSGRTFGMVRRHYSNAVTALLAMRGSSTIVNWAEEIGIGDSGYVETGYLLPVPEALADACRDNVARLAALGLDTSFVGPSEIAEIEPLLTLDGIAGAAYEPTGGFADAHKMILGWFAGAVAHGLVPRLGCAATAPDRRRRARARRAHARGRHRLRPRRARDRRLGPRTALADRGRRPDRAEAHPGRRPAPAGRRAAPQRRLLRRGHERRRSPGSRRALLRGHVLRRRAAGRRGGLRSRRLARLRGGDPARSGGALSRARRRCVAARLGGPLRLLARLEPDHRRGAGSRGAAPRAGLERARLQALARRRRGRRGRGARRRAAHRRHARCGRRASPRAGSCGSRTAPALAPDRRREPERQRLQHVLPPAARVGGKVGGWSPRRAKGSTASAPSGARAGSGSGGDGGCSGWW